MLAATPDQIQVFAGEHVSLLQSRLDFVKESHEKGAQELGAEKSLLQYASSSFSIKCSPRLACLRLRFALIDLAFSHCMSFSHSLLFIHNHNTPFPHTQPQHSFPSRTFSHSRNSSPRPSQRAPP